MEQVIEADDLSALTGIGRITAEKLFDDGVFTYEDLVAKGEHFLRGYKGMTDTRARQAIESAKAILEAGGGFPNDGTPWDDIDPDGQDEDDYTPAWGTEKDFMFQTELLDEVLDRVSSFCVTYGAIAAALALVLSRTVLIDFPGTALIVGAFPVVGMVLIWGMIWYYRR